LSIIIVIKNLVKSFGEIKALDGVNLDIEKGVIFGLLGPNGAGKTTLINCILGLIGYDSGEILVDGVHRNPSSVEFKNKIGIVPQELALYENLSAIDNLGFFGSLYSLRGSELSNRVKKLLELTGLYDRRNKRVSTYSGGMKRRLNLAIGLVHNPGIILMDEPTVGIDPQSRNLIYELVESLKKQGITILYTTHYMEEAERLCDRISIIDLGKIIVTGTLSELIEIVGTLDRIQIDLRGKILSNAFDNMFGDVQLDFDGSRLTLKTHHGRERLPEIMRKIGDSGFEITSATVFTPNLETVFLHLTGKELRD